MINYQIKKIKIKKKFLGDHLYEHYNCKALKKEDLVNLINKTKKF